MKYDEVVIDDEKVGRKIKAHRRRLDLTQEELAEIVGMSRDQISLVERGKRSLSIRSAIALCDVFGITMDYLFCDCIPNALDEILISKLRECSQAGQIFTEKMVDVIIEMENLRNN